MTNFQHNQLLNLQDNILYEMLLLELNRNAVKIYAGT
jgi:hypothetical protein